MQRARWSKYEWKSASVNTLSVDCSLAVAERWDRDSMGDEPNPRKRQLSPALSLLWIRLKPRETSDNQHSAILLCPQIDRERKSPSHAHLINKRIRASHVFFYLSHFFVSCSAFLHALVEQWPTPFDSTSRSAPSSAIDPRRSSSNYRMLSVVISREIFVFIDRWLTYVCWPRWRSTQLCQCATMVEAISWRRRQPTRKSTRLSIKLRNTRHPIQSRAGCRGRTAQ